MKVDRRLWLTADKKKLVEEGSPEAAFLWAGAGREVSESEAARLGYKPKSDKKREPKSDKKREPTPPPVEPVVSVTPSAAGSEPAFDDMTLEQLQAYALEHDVDLEGADTVDAVLEKLTVATEPENPPA